MRRYWAASGRRCWEVEGSELEHVYCEGEMVAGESKGRGKTDKMEWSWIQEEGTEEDQEIRRTELERVCCGVELASGKSKNRGGEIRRITLAKGRAYEEGELGST